MGWGDIFDGISEPSSSRPGSSASKRSGKFSHGSPAAGPSEELAAPNTVFNLTAAEGALNPETWFDHYKNNFFSGSLEEFENLLKARSDAGDSDVSSTEEFEWETAWRELANPEIEAAFGTLEIPHKPNANEKEINKMARKLYLEYHPDNLAKINKGKIPPAAEKAANEETAKIVAAREVAINYVRSKTNN